MSERRVMERQVVVRMSEALYQALKADADENGRTVAQSIRFHVKASLRKAER